MNFTNLLEFGAQNLNRTQIQTIEMNAFVANSMLQIIEEVFRRLAPSFIIVVSCRRTRGFNFYLNVLQYIFFNVVHMNIQLVFVDYKNPKRIDGLRYVNLLLVDSFEAFLDIDVISYTNNSNVNEYYHIFIMERDTYIFDHMQKIFDYCWHNHIIHCNIEYQNAQSELHLFSYFPYGTEKCGNTSPQHINQFVVDRWQHPPSFLAKLNNFYGCPLVGVLRLNPPFTYQSYGYTRIYTGFEVALIRLIAERLNFSLILRAAKEDDRTSAFLLSPDGALQLNSEIQSLDETIVIADSIRRIIEEFFMKVAPSFIIVLSCRRSRPYNFYLTIMQHLFQTVDNMIVQLVFVDHKNPLRVEGPRRFNLLLIDSYDAFLDIDVISYTKNYNDNEYYHIFLMQFNRHIDNDMQSIFNYFWNNEIINCNVEIQSAPGELQMYTYFPYIPTQCGNTRPQHINQFVDGKWLQRPYYLPKLKNFYGCPLIGVVRNVVPFAYTGVNIPRKFRGSEIELAYELSYILNFTLILSETEEDDRLWPNNRRSGFNMLNERTAHFAFGYYRKRASTAANFTTTVPHHQSSVVTAINYKAHILTPFEVLTFPFTTYTWSAMAVCFILILIITKFVHWLHPEGIRTFSIVASTFGIPIRDAPHRLESIFIFSPWLWATLMLRSIYSGLLYHLFSSDIYQSLPLSLYGATNESYISVMNEFTFNDVQDVPYYSLSNQEQNTRVIRSPNEMAALDYLMKHDKINIFAVIAQEFLMHYMQVNKTVGQFYSIPEIMMQQQLCFYLKKHSFLINQFDAIIMHLKSVGLLKLLMKRYMNSDHLLNQLIGADKMIHQNDLYGIYITCGGLYSLAVIIFLLELLSKKIMYLRRLFVLLE